MGTIWPSQKTGLDMLECPLTGLLVQFMWHMPDHGLFDNLALIVERELYKRVLFETMEDVLKQLLVNHFHYRWGHWRLKQRHWRRAYYLLGMWEFGMFYLNATPRLFMMLWLDVVILLQ